MSDVKHYNKIKEIYNDLKELGDIEGITALQAQVREVYDISLEELCKMDITSDNKPSGYWSIKENCIESAQQFNSRTDWAGGEGSAYNSAYRNGWLDECCGHMNVSTRSRRGHWNIKENCIESAQQFNSKTDWLQKVYTAYNSALKHGWLDECCAHMINTKKPSGYWMVKENCIESAQQFNSRTDWAGGEGSAYTSALKHGWLDECCAHMINTRNPVSRGHWNIKENCIESAKLFNYRSAWQKGAQSAYNSAYRNGWLDECCGHMNVNNTRRCSGYWMVKENCIESAKLFNYRTAWQKGAQSAYNSAIQNGWMDECCAHMPKRKPWTKS
jgi:hypothetical protein